MSPLNPLVKSRVVSKTLASRMLLEACCRCPREEPAPWRPARVCYATLLRHGMEGTLMKMKSGLERTATGSAL